MSIFSWGVIVHLIILRGMVDIYYNLPLADVRELRSMPNLPPSKRVIMMVYENNPNSQSVLNNFSSILDDEFLQSILVKNGTFGLAKAASWRSDQTGYAALLAGIEQNSKALFFFWKMFDHVFDSIVVHVRNAWVWISHFGADFIVETKYSPNHLFLRIKNNTRPFILARNIKCTFDPFYVHPKNPLYEDGNFFFISLSDYDLLMDLNKTTNPMLSALRFGQMLDRTVQDYYEYDGKTTIILTAHYGTAENRNVLYFMWGAGIKPSTNFSHQINQTDFPALIAALLGVEIPKNSKGVVPIDLLNVSDSHKAHALYENAKQLYTMYAVVDQERRKDQLFEPFELLKEENATHVMEEIDAKMREKDLNTTVFLWPGIPTLSRASEMTSRYNTLTKYEWHIINQVWPKINMTRNFIQTLFTGFEHIKLSDRLMLTSLLGIALIFWAIVIIERIMPIPTTNRAQRETIHCIFGNNYKTVAIRIASLTIWFFILNTVLNCVDQGMNTIQALYRLLPLINLYLIFVNFERPLNWFYDVWITSKFLGFIKAMANVWFYFFMTEIMVLGFLIFPQFSFVPVAIFSLWQMVLMRRIEACPIMVLRCTLLSISLILIMYLQTIKDQIHMKICLSYGVYFWYTYAIMANLQYCSVSMITKKDIQHFFIKWQTLIVLLTGFIVVLVSRTEISFIIEEWLKCITSVLIIWSFLSPAYGELNLEDRTVNIIISLAIPILLLCSSFEALAVLVVIMNVRFWLDLELEMNSRKITRTVSRECCSKGSYTKCYCGTQSPNLNIRSIDFKFSIRRPSDLSKNCSSDDYRRVLFWVYFVLVSILSHSSFDDFYVHPKATIELLFRSNYCIFESVTIIVKFFSCTLIPTVVFRWFLVISSRTYAEIQKIVYLFFIPFIMHTFGLIYLLPVEFEIDLSAIILWSTFPILMSLIYFVANVMTSLDLRITLSKIKLRKERVNDVNLTERV